MTYVRPSIYTNKYINIPDFRLCYPCKCLARYARSPIILIIIVVIIIIIVVVIIIIIVVVIIITIIIIVVVVIIVVIIIIITSGVLEHKWRVSQKLHYCQRIDFNFLHSSY